MNRAPWRWRVPYAWSRLQRLEPAWPPGTTVKSEEAMSAVITNLAATSTAAGDPAIAWGRRAVACIGAADEGRPRFRTARVVVEDMVAGTLAESWLAFAPESPSYLRFVP
jgi:hypothetical protein